MSEKCQKSVGNAKNSAFRYKKMKAVKIKESLDIKDFQRLVRVTGLEPAQPCDH